MESARWDLIPTMEGACRDLVSAVEGPRWHFVPTMESARRDLVPTARKPDGIELHASERFMIMLNRHRL
jgi:hypothetical protein